MRRLTKTEQAAAAAVLTMAAAVAGTGISLLKKQARLMSQRAAAHFKDQEEDTGKVSGAPAGKEASLDAQKAGTEPGEESDGAGAAKRKYIKL